MSGLNKAQCVWKAKKYIFLCRTGNRKFNPTRRTLFGIREAKGRASCLEAIYSANEGTPSSFEVIFLGWWMLVELIAFPSPYLHFKTIFIYRFRLFVLRPPFCLLCLILFYWHYEWSWLRTNGTLSHSRKEHIGLDSHHSTWSVSRCPLPWQT